jgi:excisionase family DNA binding protein
LQTKSASYGKKSNTLAFGSGCAPGGLTYFPRTPNFLRVIGSYRSYMTKYYSVQETALLLGLSVSTIRRILKNGELRSYRTRGLGRGKHLITLEQIDQFLQVNKNVEVKA